ncbi:TRAP transporter small permease [Frigidibacter sp. ROC022]|uniref:TRAP transporter small permease n=1 Tax=Frigidibacter sp. ROC022 TaxID=2971796 RepID=UPI00215AA0F1|nr:TRAP transporter small permease [Frigidibacter sp. ROC022]MCR8723867.1 TRAP transporter small permease [Frigidibacter sp. ROC022]
MYRTLESWARGLAVLMAWAGGLALLLVVALTVVSILGRAGDSLGLGLKPLPGDTEYVEFGIGFAVFAFLPWCTYARAHASVDLLQPVLGRRLNRLIDLIADIGMLSLALLLTWRLWLGMLDKRGYHETTFILRAEIWWGYAAGMVGAVAFCLVAAFAVLRSARALTGATEQGGQAA